MSGDGSRDGGFGGRIPCARRASLLPCKHRDGTRSMCLNSQLGVFVWVYHCGLDFMDSTIPLYLIYRVGDLFFNTSVSLRVCRSRCRV